MSYLTQLTGKHILVLGLGKTGLSCVRFLMAHQATHNYRVSVLDSRKEVAGLEELAQSYPKLSLHTGGWHANVIAQADVIVASPGVDVNQPEIAESVASSTELIGDVELFARIDTRPVIAVTGSNGKSTVVSLLNHLGQACGVNTVIGGNFGTPVLDLIDQDFELLVLELSSFQIEQLSSLEAAAATVLNICDDHLDRHETIENYQAIKLRLFEQTRIAVVNTDFPELSPNKRLPQFSFGSSVNAEIGQGDHFGLDEIDGDYWLTHSAEPLIKESALPLAGRHNSYNVLAALALGYAAGWSLDSMVKGLSSFTGLEHRCERVPSNDGVLWINDSKATNVGATLAAIEGLAPQLPTDGKLILIAGGEGKGADFSELSGVFSQYVGHLLTIGTDGSQLAALSDSSQACDSLESAVAFASSLAAKGDIVLLSPACASFDMFANFEQRGKAFKALVDNTSAHTTLKSGEVS